MNEIDVYKQWTILKEHLTFKHTEPTNKNIKQHLILFNQEGTSNKEDTLLLLRKL